MSNTGEPVKPGARLLDALEDAAVTLLFFAAAWGSEALRIHFKATPVLEATAFALELGTAAVAWINLAQILWYRTPLHWLGRLKVIVAIKTKLFVDDGDNDDHAGGDSGGGSTPPPLAARGKPTEPQSDDGPRQGYLRVAPLRVGQAAISAPPLGAFRRLRFSCMAAVFATPVLMTVNLHDPLTTSGHAVFAFLLAGLIGLLIAFALTRWRSVRRQKDLVARKRASFLDEMRGPGREREPYLSHSDAWSTKPYVRQAPARSPGARSPIAPLVGFLGIAVVLILSPTTRDKLWAWLLSLFG